MAKKAKNKKKVVKKKVLGIKKKAVKSKPVESKSKPKSIKKKPVAAKPKVSKKAQVTAHELIKIQRRRSGIESLIKELFSQDLDTSLFNERTKRLNGIYRQVEHLARELDPNVFAKDAGMLVDLYHGELESHKNEEVIVPFEYLDESKQHIKGDVRILRKQFVKASPSQITVVVDSKKHTISVDINHIISAWLSGKNEVTVKVDGKGHSVLTQRVLHYIRHSKAVTAISGEVGMLKKAKAPKDEIAELERIHVSYLDVISDLAKSFVSSHHENRSAGYHNSYLYKLTKATMVREAVNMCIGATVHFIHEGKNQFGRLKGILDDKIIVEVEDEKGFWLLKPKKHFHIGVDNIVYVRPEDLIHQLKLKETIEDLSRHIMDGSADPNKVLKKALSTIKYMDSNPKLLERVVSLARDYRIKNCYDRDERDSAKKLDLVSYRQMEPQEKLLVLRDGIHNL